MPSPTATTTRCVRVVFRCKLRGHLVVMRQPVRPPSAAGRVGEHVALHHQRRLLLVGKAEERGPWRGPVQAGGEKAADAAQRRSTFRCDSVFFFYLTLHLLDTKGMKLTKEIKNRLNIQLVLGYFQHWMNISGRVCR